MFALRARRARFRGTVNHQGEAISLLEKPGDIVMVERGVPRLLVFSCPDGCGDIVPVNLDERADKAWRFYRRDGRSTLYPSVWRDEGCQAHFVLWNDMIYWSGFSDGEEQSSVPIESVIAMLSHDEFRSYFLVAVELEEIPWAVRAACEQLVRDRLAEEGTGKMRGRYRLI